MTARKTALRLTKPGEKATPPKPARVKTVTEAAEKGTTRELLAAMRSRIAKAVEDPTTPGRDLAALTNRLMQIVREIEAMDAREDEGDESALEVTDGDFDASAV